MTTSKQHEKVLKEYIKELRSRGYRVIDLERKCPDGIAIRLFNDKIELSAIEVLGSQYKKGKGWGHKWTYKAKESIYHMFDKVLIKSFHKEKK